MICILVHGDATIPRRACHEEALSHPPLLTVPRACAGRLACAHRHMSVRYLQAKQQTITLPAADCEEALSSASIGPPDGHRRASRQMPCRVDHLCAIIVPHEVKCLQALQAEPSGVFEDIPETPHRLHRDQLHLRQRSDDLVAVREAGHLPRSTLLRKHLPGDFPLVQPLLHPGLDLHERALWPLIVTSVHDEVVSSFPRTGPFHPHTSRS
mmetsp:Transcript_59986/g.143218  ORF Transcript_59986/g.143218 Transcript_59986/m.143218 type:complete len:211 (+) Transcript_59986:371-1003(+)